MTPSRTPTTSSAPADALAGTAVQIANGLSAIPAVITALVSGLEFGEALLFAPAGETAGAGGNCPLGGTATRTCGGAGVGRTMALAFDACEVPTSAGSVVIDELPPAAQAVTLSGSLVCPIPLPPWATTIGLEAVFRSPQDALQLTARASLTGTVQPQLDLGSACRATGATLTLDGTIRSTFADGSPVGLTFDGTVINVAIAAFNPQCVPINYTMTFNGPARLATGALAATLGAGGAADDAVDVVFDDFVVAQNATGTPTLTTLAGDLGVACANSTLTFETLQSLAQAVGEPCPQAGVLRVTAGAQQTRLLYRAGGGVGLDTDNDGVSEEELGSCQDAPLLCADPGAGTPTASPTRSATPIATATRSATATATRTATASPTPLISSTPTATGQATATATRTATATVTGTPTASATRTATASLTPSATGTPNPVPQSFCDTLPGPASIPDGNAGGLLNEIVVPPTGQTVVDLNVTLAVAHTYVGDLRVTLTHVNSGRSIVLLDRPGLPGLEFGCQLDDIDATFDDASQRPAEARCLEGPPWAAIDSSMQPTEPLATFGGDSLAGTWRLNVADVATQDTGALLGWCLEVNSRSPVVTDFTCVDQDQCVIVVGEPFSLNFAYLDPNGDAVSWDMRGRPVGGGSEFVAGGGPIVFGADGTFVVDFDPFTCPSGNCSDSTFDYFVTVRDQQGNDSVAQRLRIIVSVFGG
ncbi:MAG: proprotein convertase P-domain-containing protein [Candidatus Binatia bacterium]